MHAGFMAMTACFDHLRPYSRGGATDLENMVLCCWPCNNGRADLTLAEVELLDPRGRLPGPGLGWEQWDGLTAFTQPA
jgi:5-methylcytosine-specific restriction endonuclease McrA